MDKDMSSAVCIRCYDRKAAVLPARGVPLSRHRGLVLHATFHPTAHDVVFSCGQDHSVKLWTLATRLTVTKGEPTRTPGDHGIAQGHWSLSERIIRRWDLSATLLQAFVRRGVPYRKKEAHKKAVAKEFLVRKKLRPWRRMMLAEKEKVKAFLEEFRLFCEAVCFLQAVVRRRKRFARMLAEIEKEWAIRRKKELEEERERYLMERKKRLEEEERFLAERKEKLQKEKEEEDRFLKERRAQLAAGEEGSASDGD